MILFTNTLSQKKEEFHPLHEKTVNMYVCGITPYDYAHIGHGRCYVTFDVIYRMLLFSGYNVCYARNFTDIDDKILKKAEQEFGDASRFQEITQRYIQAFNHDMKTLQCLTPTNQPYVTEMIPQIIAFTQGLIDNGSAYAKNGSVYFRVSTAQDYGKLSKQSIKDLHSGARVEIDEDKENPLDFALWKKDDQIGYSSPWGKGRPGWHIECSAMAEDIFHSTLDIHGGGMDLIFPHHENEIAQSQGLFKRPFVKTWIHNAFVRINKEKMSKSLGNFFTLQDIFKDVDPMVLRFYFLKHHYRNPLDFSLDDIHAAQTAYKRLIKVFNGIDTSFIKNTDLVHANLLVADLLACLHDDLNTSEMFGILFEKLPTLEENDTAKAYVKYFIQHVLGLSLNPLLEKKVIITPEIQSLIDKRLQARAQKNWALADQIRDQLLELGIDIHDTKL